MRRPWSTGGCCAKLYMYMQLHGKCTTIYYQILRKQYNYTENVQYYTNTSVCLLTHQTQKSIEGINVKSVQIGSSSFLDVGVCRISLASQVLLNRYKKQKSLDRILRNGLEAGYGTSGQVRFGWVGLGQVRLGQGPQSIQFQFRGQAGI